MSRCVPFIVLLSVMHLHSSELNAQCEWSLADSGDPNGIESPHPREFHAMCFAGGNRVLLHGGNYGPYVGDTWIWDDNEWTRLNDGPVRADHSLVYDSERNVVILFGGYDGQWHNDLWEWSPISETWSLVTTTGSVPSPRYRHEMVYDYSRRVIVLFGGHDATELLGDTWELDTANQVWTLVADDDPQGEAAPFAREFHQMAFVGFGKTILHGGNHGPYEGDTWLWNGQIWRRLIDGPPRADHTLIFDCFRDVVMLFGGYDGQWHNDTWNWSANSETWMPATAIGNIPSERYRHCMVYVPPYRASVMFGGGLGFPNFEASTYTLSCCGGQCCGITDSDSDGVHDLCDNCMGVLNSNQEDVDQDGIGDACDPCGQRRSGDVNGDRRINGSDIALFIDVYFGESVDPIVHCSADVGGSERPCEPDGMVDFEDLEGFVSLLLGHSCACSWK